MMKGRWSVRVKVWSAVCFKYRLEVWGLGFGAPAASARLAVHGTKPIQRFIDGSCYTLAAFHDPEATGKPWTLQNPPKDLDPKDNFDSK